MKNLRLVLILALGSACASPTAPRPPAAAPAGLRIGVTCPSLWKIQLDTADLGILWFGSTADTLRLPDAVGTHQIYGLQVDPSSGWALGHSTQSVTAPAVVTLRCAA